MVELVALSVAAFVATLAVMYGVPRAVGGTTASSYGTWPDVLGGLDRAQDRWFALPGVADLVAAVVTLLVLAAGITISLDPAVIGAEAGSLLAGVGVVLVLFGLGLLALVTYLRVRRAGISNAGSLLISGSVTGAALTIVILYILLQQG